MIEKIENHQLVKNHFGYWPEFHDAEIIRICCDRNLDTMIPTVGIKLYVKEKQKHCIIDFEMIGIKEIEIEGFNYQNIVFGIDFGEENGFLTVDINPTFGVSGYISAKRVKVTNLDWKEGEPKK